MTARTRPPASTQALAKASVNQRQVAHGGQVWIDMIQPDVAEATYLRERFSFDAPTLEDVLSKLERPKLDVYAEAGYLFAVLRFPVLDRDQRIAGSSEVDLFVGRDYLIMLHEGDLRPLRRMFAAAGSDEHARAQLMGRGPGYLLYRIIDALVRHCFPMLFRVEDQLARLEDRAFGRGGRALVRDLALARRDLIALRAILAPNLPVVRELAAREHAFLKLDGAVYFGDVVDGSEKLCDVLDEQQALAASLSATLDSLAAQRNGELLRILVVVAVVLLPLMLAVSVYQLIAGAPFAQHPLTFILLIVAMLGAAGGLVAYFRYKDWI